MSRSTGLENKDNPILQAALGYSRLLKWSVFPVHSIVNGRCTCNKWCTSPGKHPRTYDGFKSATTDEVIIKMWFTRYPDSNIGIITGRKNGFFVLDVDPKHNGYESLRQLTDKYGSLPDTVEAITGSGGRHYLFKYHDGIGNKSNLLSGLDIRGEGGYIVVAPSNHISGMSYEWATSSKPYQQKIAAAPKWLMDMLLMPQKNHRTAKSSSYWVNLFNNTSQGSRNNAAASIAGYLLKKYVDPRLVVEILHLWNEFKVMPSLPEKELNKIINSIAGKEVDRRKRGKYG